MTKKFRNQAIILTLGYSALSAQAPTEEAKPPSTEQTQLKAPPTIKAGAFIDTYYSTGAMRPASRDRQFLTQPARDREFNINIIS